MRRVIVGTAGHIDHGKTRLVAALTGIDCDRLAEEKERGITIDLGFAHLSEGDLQLGFIDVPGHERFVHNALAGLGGIRVMLLVVAADEGVKPQTREHLAICSLLGIPQGIAVLTKTDLVSEDLLDLAKLELEELLGETPFAGAPLLTVSSETGKGVSELKTALLALAAELPPDPALPRQPTRLPVDRSFHLRGLGVLTTGTLVSGRVRSGDTLRCLPADKTIRVRSVQVHGKDRDEAIAGERTALQLSGIPLEEVRRGMQLVTPEAFGSSRSLCARFTLLPDAPAALRAFVPVRYHLYSSEVLGKLRPLDCSEIKPGETGVVEIRLHQPVVAVRGDRFIVRRPSPQTTLGGGEILDPRWRRPRGKALERALDGLRAEAKEALVYWVETAGEGGVSGGGLAQRLGMRLDELEKTLADLRAEQRLLEVGDGPGRSRRWLAPAAFQLVVHRAERVLKEYFQRQRLARGMPKAEAVRRILPGRAATLADVYLTWLEAQKVLVLEGDRVNLPGRSGELTDEESQLAKSIVAEFERQGLTPPSPAEIQTSIGAKPQIFEGVLRYLLERERLVRLPNDLIVAHAAIDKLCQDLEATDWQSFSVGQFKDQFGLTRKWAIPLLEYLDSTGRTRRVGDVRQLVRK